MGIHGLYGLLQAKCPEAIREAKGLEHYTGYTIAIDASMSLYAFMVAIRDSGSNQVLTNEAGDATSHITGMFARATRLLEAGIKPLYVFDGKPPEAKSGELQQRKDMKEQAAKDLKDAEERGDTEAMAKLSKRTVKITKKHSEDVMHLFRMMGVPALMAPSEAEAQCASLVKEGLVYAVATEDADALTFGASKLIRSLTVSEARQKQYPPCTIDLEQILTSFEFTMDQFIDFCILCGCDYTKSIRGIGPTTAYTMIQKYKTIENVIENLDPVKYTVPEHFPFEIARREFMTPEVYRGEDVPSLVAPAVDYEALKTWLVETQNFNEKRVDSMIDRLKKVHGGRKQSRLESFFGAATYSAKPKPKVKAKGKGGRNSIKSKMKR